MANYTQAPWVEGNKTTYSEFKVEDEAFNKKPTLWDGFKELKQAFTDMVDLTRKKSGPDKGKSTFREIFSGNKGTKEPKTLSGTKIPTNLGDQKALEQLFIKKPTASDDMDLSFANSLKIAPSYNKYNDLINDKYGYDGP